MRGAVSALLPPLPRIGTADAGFRPAGRGMLAILGEQHAQLADLTTRLADHPPRPQPLTSVLIAELSRHLCAEEQYLYPAVRAALPDGAALAARERAADQEMRRLADSLADPAPLRAALRSHIRRCEWELFPRLDRALDVVTLIRLGNRVEIALEAAPSRPRPTKPDTPPWKKWLDPLVGAVDKVRDALTRRVTYPEDLCANEPARRSLGRSHPRRVRLTARGANRRGLSGRC
jgi:Hemerythrin HHE cation binding domain